jgi:hypothetical protein
VAAGVRGRVRRAIHPRIVDLANAVRHGRAGPRFAERLWVRPDEVTLVVAGRAGAHSGTVARGDWDLAAAPINTMPKYAACMDHWLNGTPWSDTGIYEIVLRLIAERGRRVDGCLTRQDVIERYRRLDEVFEQVRADGRLRTGAELNGRSERGRCREDHGVLIHIGRSGTPIHGRGGTHRLAIAVAVGLPVIPARIGLLHPGALRTWRTTYSAGMHLPPGQLP